MGVGGAGKVWGEGGAGKNKAEVGGRPKNEEASLCARPARPGSADLSDVVVSVNRGTHIMGGSDYKPPLTSMDLNNRGAGQSGSLSL